MIKKQNSRILFIAVSIVSSKDEPTSTPAIAFTQAEGKAVNGEYNITGTITSSVLY
jgi:hypothetical protein